MSDVYIVGSSGGGGGGSGTVVEIDTNNGITGGPITVSGTVGLTLNSRTRNIGAVFNSPTSGQTFFVYIPYSGTITAATILADQSGSAVVDVWKVALTSIPANSSNSIAASDLPTLSSAIQNRDTTLTGWTTSISAGDVIYFHLNSASTVVTINVVLTVVTN